MMPKTKPTVLVSSVFNDDRQAQNCQHLCHLCVLAHARHLWGRTVFHCCVHAFRVTGNFRSSAATTCSRETHEAFVFAARAVNDAMTIWIFCDGWRCVCCWKRIMLCNYLFVILNMHPVDLYNYKIRVSSSVSECWKWKPAGTNDRLKFALIVVTRSAINRTLRYGIRKFLEIYQNLKLFTLR